MEQLRTTRPAQRLDLRGPRLHLLARHTPRDAHRRVDRRRCELRMELYDGSQHARATSSRPGRFRRQLPRRRRHAVRRAARARGAALRAARRRPGARACRMRGHRRAHPDGGDAARRRRVRLVGERQARHRAPSAAPHQPRRGCPGGEPGTRHAAERRDAPRARTRCARTFGSWARSPRAPPTNGHGSLLQAWTTLIAPLPADLDPGARVAPVAHEDRAPQPSRSAKYSRIAAST